MMNNYHIILEEVLTPELNKKYLDELRAKGWIHTNVNCKRKKDDIYYLSLTCTCELLGKVVGFLLERVGWLIVEQVSDKILKKDEVVPIQTHLPF